MDDFGKLIGQISRRIGSGKITQSKMKQLDMRSSEVPFLMALKTMDGSSQDELANAVGVNKAHAGRVLADLEVKGLITRSMDQNDHRKRLVYRTNIWEERIEELTSVTRGINERLFKGISQEEQELTLNVLARVVENLKNE